MRLHQQATVPPIIPPKTQNPKAPKPEPYPKKKKKDLKGSQRAEAQWTLGFVTYAEISRFEVRVQDR